MALLLNNQRVILVGGKGGVGKTTTSATLALLAAERGRRVLVVSTDPAHSLADAFDRPIGDKITRVAPNLDGLEIDPDEEVVRHLEQVSRQLKRFTRPELYGAVERQIRLTGQSPGAQEAALLECIARTLEHGLQHYDLVIFDTAPTGHTLRLLALPEAMAAWTQGLLKSNQQSDKFAKVLDHLTPNSGKDIDNPLSSPEEHATSGLDERHKAIAEILLNRQRLLQRTRETFLDGSQTAILFVLTPEKLPILETTRAVRSLTDEKLPVAGIVINRILPTHADGEFLALRRQQEKQHLQEIDQQFSHLKRYPIPLQATDIQGTDQLMALGTQFTQAGF
ncbi:ArsA family ATPase [bacterium 19MO03SA05]|uniref:ArsA family ATPase n=1 Tax=bacterium 19MO03SA05 TaxID=2920620 RepID=A0AAU6VB55_UNCXX|nr:MULTISPECIES: ArsA family ATPase [unclassified Vibrio]EKO3571211.1 ArsA family ATPase [Vibrio metschnikovii]EKO3920210.1 ArsA family ATPase [Vibrio metschnikovii]MDQ2107148.1 ArsA family ATPase [Vibrio sp. 2017_1457_15]MDQ2159960.1 ArsA family ATPase [Vibrio sp. 2017_1457_13]MDQ2188729.1 ArsA family ATPase [Vibrio sp. A14(2019)]